MGGLRTAFIHNGTWQQSSIVPRCLGDARRADVADQGKGNTGEDRIEPAASTVKILFLIYSLKCYPNTVSKGRGGARKKKKKAVPVLSEKLTGPENVRTNTVSFITLPHCFHRLYKKEDLESCKPEYPGYKDMCTEDIKIQYIEAQRSGSRRQQSKRRLPFAVSRTKDARASPGT